LNHFVSHKLLLPLPDLVGVDLESGCQFHECLFFLNGYYSLLYSTMTVQ
jgi:hypothetical protein